jgi:hypothetical protein
MFKNDGIVGVEQQLDTTGTKAVKKMSLIFHVLFFRRNRTETATNR